MRAAAAVHAGLTGLTCQPVTAAAMSASGTDPLAAGSCPQAHAACAQGRTPGAALRQPRQRWQSAHGPCLCVWENSETTIKWLQVPDGYTS
jgi:hypothetical protein